MSTSNTRIAQQVKKFCTHIATDPLLVQGAGGNVSWKDGDLLWVKASGTWLAEAESKDLFVPVNLPHLQLALARQDFLVTPKVMNSSELRPSIETLLHALMPHKVVVHLHPVELLTHLVQLNPQLKLNSLVSDTFKWIYVDYFKPGNELAKAIFLKLNKNNDQNVVFMGNHGVLIGGDFVDEVLHTLQTLIRLLKTTPLQFSSIEKLRLRQPDFAQVGYKPCLDNNINLLALNDLLINRVRHDWALYPDHVVFLNYKAAILEFNFNKLELTELVRRKPPYIFAIGDGVYESYATTITQRYQLKCYFDVVSRLSDTSVVSPLSNQQAFQLLDWEAEKFRINLSVSS